MTQAQKRVIKKYKYQRSYFSAWFHEMFRQRWNEEMERGGIV